MPRLTVALLSGLLLATPIVAEAQPQPGRSLLRERRAEVRGVTPQAGIIFEDPTGGWSTIGFYARRIPSPDRRTAIIQWSARRTEGRGEAAGVPVWADEARCPVLRDVIRSLSWISPGSMRVASMDPDSATRPPPADASYVTIWTEGGVQADGSGARIDVRVPNGPIETWARSANAQLASCWRPTPN